MNITETLDYIHSVCWKGMMPGLERINELLGKMGNPEKDLKFIHIAGTNGKGSTAAMTASILRKAGYEVSAKQFMRIGVPFTLTAVCTGYLLAWFLYT